MTLMEAIKQLYELQNAEDMPIYYRPAISKIINGLLWRCSVCGETQCYCRNCGAKYVDAQGNELVPVKHGHWIGDVCSECGKDALCDCDKYEIYGTIHSDYCPHCGAKIDEVEDVKTD